MIREENTNICYLYVLDTLADWEIAYLTAEINSKRYLNGPNKKMQLLKIGDSFKPVKSMGGLTITPDIEISGAEILPGDILVLPGADTWLEEDRHRILNVVEQIMYKQITIAAICGATVALAKRRLLNNRRHTSNNGDFLKMFVPEYSGGDHYVDEPVVTDENLITASGVAPLEFTCEVFKKTDAMKKETLEAWYQLYKTKKAEYFFALMDSLKQ